MKNSNIENQEWIKEIEDISTNAPSKASIVAKKI
jgi:hypothetical protein